MSLSKRSKKRKIFSHHKKNSVLSLALVLIFTLFSFALFRICSDRQAQFETKLAELDEVNERTELLERRIELLTVHVSTLETDAGVEEVAREKLGLVKPGEIAYSVLPQPPSEFVAHDDQSLLFGSKKVKEVEKDRGLVIRALRHLFGTEKPEVKVSSNSTRNLAAQ